MPNLVYVSRGKCIKLPHNFKAGALDVLVSWLMAIQLYDWSFKISAPHSPILLSIIVPNQPCVYKYKYFCLYVLKLRISATMTNATVILTLDSDMYSNDPQTPLRALCYLLDPSMDPKLALCSVSSDLLRDQQEWYLWWWSQACISNSSRGNGWPETSELNQDHLVNKSIESREVLSSAHHVAGCNFESQTQWGTKVGLVTTGILDWCQFWSTCLINSVFRNWRFL